jgi:hypothetical protein
MCRRCWTRGLGGRTVFAPPLPPLLVAGLHSGAHGTPLGRLGEEKDHEYPDWPEQKAEHAPQYLAVLALSNQITSNNAGDADQPYHETVHFAPLSHDRRDSTRGWPRR